MKGLWIRHFDSEHTQYQSFVMLNYILNTKIMKITQLNQFDSHLHSILCLAHAYRSTTFPLAFFASQNLTIPSRSDFPLLTGFPFPLCILRRVESQTRTRIPSLTFWQDFCQKHKRKFAFPLCFECWILKLFEWKGF